MMLIKNNTGKYSGNDPCRHVLSGVAGVIGQIKKISGTQYSGFVTDFSLVVKYTAFSV